MKAFLLAAGHGTRLRPLTDHTPKCLLPIRGVPLLGIWLQICAALGIDEVLINIHYRADQVREFLNQRDPHPKVIVVEEKELLGSGGTLRANQKWVAGEDLFWVFYADVLNSNDLHSMMDAHRRSSPAVTLGVYRVPDPSRCGIVELSADNVVERFVEKPRQPASDLAFSGIMIGTPAFLEAIPPGKSDIGYDVLPKLGGQMIAYPITGYLLDIGTMDNYEQAQITWPGLPLPV